MTLQHITTAQVIQTSTGSNLTVLLANTSPAPPGANQALLYNAGSNTLGATANLTFNVASNTLSIEGNLNLSNQSTIYFGGQQSNTVANSLFYIAYNVSANSLDFFWV